MLMSSDIHGLIKLLLPDLKQIILADQSAKRPAKPYAMFKMGTEIGIGMPIKTTEDSTDNPTEKITESVQQLKTANIEVNFYTDTEGNLKKKKAEIKKIARQFCNEFLEKLYLTYAQDYMLANNFSLFDTKDFSDIGEYLGDKHERRALCELTLHYIGEQEADIPFFEKQDDTEITGNYKDEAGNDI